ncbi:hypothetical protein RFI_09661 [Reticulomyxa filosa]|uniref:Uncharacterized protein n=1 Tax=Reticulomyxa filosa TaxID=46433 RepID=X6NNB0_RETFI|nr:hypothetical protein RFI_09661 [Reticulomyxa filosa]|eukprot:ETO27471.1 hypothetical protein RFI_09661 [Reticulomyxa filosa]
MKRLQYWKPGIAKHKRKHDGEKSNNASENEPRTKYMTFWTDCGGFNNIRMAFEYMVIVAKLTNRILVTPPEQGWYLIDWGEMSRMKTEDQGGLSDYSGFFDFEDLNLEVATMTTLEFIHTFGETVNMPEIWIQHAKTKSLQYRIAEWMNDYKKWCNEYADKHNSDMPWGPLGNVLFWPSITEVQKKQREPSDAFLANRRSVEYTQTQQDMPWIHFPSCEKEDPGISLFVLDYRYLGQISTFVWFSDRNDDLALRRVLRDHVHLRKEIFEYASYAIEYLGLFQYAALHIRRNELQYKESFIEATESLKHIRPL